MNVGAILENIGINEKDWILCYIGKALDLLENSNDLFDLLKNYKDITK